MRNGKGLTAIAAAAIAVAVTAIGCSRKAEGHAPEAQPLHVSVVVAPSDTAGASDVSEAGRAAAFAEWAGQAIHRPGSTFEVWVAGSTRESYRRHFFARVPDSWGRNVMEAKADFVRLARDRAISKFALAPAAAVLPEGGDSLRPSNEGGEKVVFVSPGSVRAIVSVGGAKGLPVHQTVVCDLSDSGVGLTCNAERVAALYDQWLIRAISSPESSFSVFYVGTSRDTCGRALDVMVPTGSSTGERATYLSGARQEILRLVGGQMRANASAIVEAVNVAAEQIAERPGQHYLAVLSDLRQVTPSRWNFEIEAPDEESFVQWLREQRLLADLHSVPVTVCGLHNLREPNGPRFDARLHHGVRIAWEAAFRAMGVTNLKMYSDCSGAAVVAQRGNS